MEWSAQHLYPTTRDRTQERGGREPRHKRFIIWTCQQKRTVWTEHGKVHQFWMCYTNPFTFAETWAGFEVSHSYPFGPIWPCHHSQMVWRRMRSSDTGGGGGGNYLFIAPVALARWLSLSFLPRLVGEYRGQYAGPRCLENTLLCAMVLSQHNSRQSVWWGCCQPPTWAPNFEAGLQYNIIYSFATVEIIQRFLWTWDHTRSDQKEALVGCLTVSKSTHVCFPSPQTTVITEIILH